MAPASSPAPPPIRIGSVPYLNSKVLIYGLEPAGTAPDGTPYTLELHTPSVLAKKLRAGEVDVALVSSIEYFRNPDYLIVPGLSVSGQAEMWSIRLFHRVPLQRLRRVALDPASETTNALLRIILLEKQKLDVEFVALERGEDPLARADLDGFLKIGDPALAFHEPGFEHLDLMSAWRALTGLPFVFAVWLVRRGVELRGVERLLVEAKRGGMEHASEIARAQHLAAGLSIERAREYIASIVHYDLGAEEFLGLTGFQKHLKRLGELTRERTVDLYEPERGWPR